jgi:phage gpG-like protein
MSEETISAGDMEFTIIGRDEAIARGPNIYRNLKEGIRTALGSEMVRVAEYVRLNKLQGQVLNHRTGGLSRAVTGQIVSDTGDKIVGQVGVKGIPYAFVHEFGGTFNVPGHFRQQTMVFGKPVIPRMVAVKPHTVTFPVRSFLRTSADENRAQVSDKLRATTLGVIRAS